MPDIGNFKNVEIIEVNVQEGEEIEAEATLITLESDKSSMEIPSPYAGKVQKLHVKEGERVSEGTLILSLEMCEGASEKAPEKAPEEISSKQTQESIKETPKQASEPEEPQSTALYTSPLVRRLAREFDIDLNLIQGTGHKGRISKEDIQGYVKAQLAIAKTGGGSGLGVIPMPDIDFAQFGEIEMQPLKRIKKLTAENLHRNWVMIPHVTQFDEVDITEMEAFRKEQQAALKKDDIRLTPLVFLMKAAVSSLKAYPQFNASLTPDGQQLTLKKYFHIGIAVDTPNGLVVPVIRDVDQKGLIQLSVELSEISAKARAGKLPAADMQGSCFTISSLGGIGGTAFTPIINAPDVAILGVSKSQVKPVYKDEQFVPRLMLPLSLSYDHRVIDGAEAARFVTHFGSILNDLRKILL